MYSTHSIIYKIEKDEICENILVKYRINSTFIEVKSLETRVLFVKHLSFFEGGDMAFSLHVLEQL